MSRIHSKLVYVYIVTYVQDEWNNYVKEIEDLHITMGNFTVSIDSLVTNWQQVGEIMVLYPSQSIFSHVRS